VQVHDEEMHAIAALGLRGSRIAYGGKRNLVDLGRQQSILELCEPVGIFSRYLGSRRNERS
jgi:hypothetical protein